MRHRNGRHQVGRAIKRIVYMLQLIEACSCLQQVLATIVRVVLRGLQITSGRSHGLLGRIHLRNHYFRLDLRLRHQLLSCFDKLRRQHSLMAASCVVESAGPGR